MSFSVVENHTLYLGGLSLLCTESHIFTMFNKFGPIASIHLMKKRLSKKGVVYAFITFQEVRSANDALRMNGNHLLGKQIR
jgi:RNA recognition motif-containing protein